MPAVDSRRQRAYTTAFPKEAHMSKSWKPAAVGALAGALLVLAIQTVLAARAFTLADVEADPRKFWGNSLTLSGYVGSTVRRSTRTVDFKTRRQQEFLSFSIYPSPAKTAQKYVSVTLPAEQFRYLPAEGQPIEVTGVLKAPSTLGSID